MKFFNLFKKELKEMLSVSTIATMIGMIVLMVLIGNSMSGAIEKSTQESGNIIICDQDKSEFTKAFLNQLKTQIKQLDGKMKTVDMQSDDYSAELKRLNIKNVVIIPKGFTEQVEKHKTADVVYVQRMNSLSQMANISTGSEVAKKLIETSVKSTIYADNMMKKTMTQQEVTQLELPINVNEYTVVADKSENISSSIVMAMCSMQGMFVPIVMFALIMFSSQMILNAISTEKIDKTLETLLSAPISRMSVLCAKMLSAGIVAALQAVSYMIGMNQMMGSVTGNLSDTGNYDKMLEKLGLTLSTSQYVMVGIQMFLSILIALSLSLILGALAKDAKSAQTLLLPITFMTMIPYMISMLMDIKTASPVIKYLVYAIPFSHSFMASENVMFGNNQLYIGGLVYQIVVLVIFMTVALRIFMSDKIITISIGGERKNKFKTKKK